MRINVNISLYAEFERHVCDESVVTTESVFSDTVSLCRMDAEHLYMHLVHAVTEHFVFNDFMSTIGEVERICCPRLLSCVSRLPSFYKEFCEKSESSDRFALSWRDVVPDSLVRVHLFKDGDYVVSKLCLMLLDFKVIERD